MIFTTSLCCALIPFILAKIVFGAEKANSMCTSYASYVYVYEHGPTLQARSVSYLTSKCGIVETQLIVGGTKSHIMEFPHMAAVGFGQRDDNPKNVNWMCGGSLISERFVVSAAHCVQSRQYGEATSILLGVINLKRMGGAARMIRIKRAIPYPTYKTTSKYDDIALFELVQNVQFNEYIRPACLNTDTNITWSHAIASGFGLLTFDGRQRSDHLMRVTLKNIKNGDCSKTYPIGRYMRNGLAATQFCAGEMAGKKDTCQGDSGGPLQIVLMNPYCMYSIIGITSFGKFCGFAKSPGMYTNVAHYIDWIESIVWP